MSDASSPHRSSIRLSPAEHDRRQQRSIRSRRLLEEAHRTSDAGRRAQLLDDVVLLNKEVAVAVANRYRGRSVAQEDLEQAAFEGLVKAVHKFDPSVRPDLLTYAVPTIRGEIQRHFRDRCWAVRPPRHIQELQWRISRSVEELSHRLGHEPDEAEVCAHVGCTPEEYDEARRAFGAFQPASLDRPVDQTDGLTLADALPDTGPDEQAAAEARAILVRALRRLPPRDRRIVHMRFFEERSQREIGDKMGVTQMQVSRLIARILRDLRAEIMPESA